MQAYNPDVVLDLLDEHLRQRGRGAQTRLAEAVGVRVQTVNKWSKRQTSPEPDKWPAIEDHFELPRGTIRRAVGWDAAAPDDEIAALRTDVRSLADAVQALTATVATILQDLDRLDTGLDALQDGSGSAPPRRPAKPNGKRAH